MSRPGLLALPPGDPSPCPPLCICPIWREKQGRGRKAVRMLPEGPGACSDDRQALLSFLWRGSGSRQGEGEGEGAEGN
jgi:hypothetical protein